MKKRSQKNNWPPAFTIAEIRRVCGPWTHERLTRILERSGIVDHDHIPFLVHEDKLKEHFPVIWQRLYTTLVLGQKPGQL